MNRRNKLKSDLELFEYIANKGYALGTDFIVGHPGETDELWKEAMANLQNFPLTHIHSFTYSKRDGTPSAIMKGEINGAISKERNIELINIVNEKNRLFREKLSIEKSPLEVLIESKKDNTNDTYVGYDQFFNKVEVQSDSELIGDWIYLDNYNVIGDLNVSRFK